MPSFDSSVWGRKFAVRAVVGLALTAVILWRTNPTHLRHVAGLYPGRPAQRDRIDWSRLTPAERGVAERNHPQTSNTEYHDYFLFSATTDRGAAG